MFRIGHHPNGFGLYLFDYKVEFQGAWGRGRQFGVMADEVESVMPDGCLCSSRRLQDGQLWPSWDQPQRGLILATDGFKTRFLASREGF